MDTWEFEAVLWPWAARTDSWVFLTLPADIGEEVRLSSGPPRGFGSVRVEVTIGTTTWRTSVFPEKERGFVLPVKKDVRRREGLEEGDVATVRLQLA